MTATAQPELVLFAYVRTRQTDRETEHKRPKDNVLFNIRNRFKIIFIWTIVLRRVFFVLPVHLLPY